MTLRLKMHDGRVETYSENIATVVGQAGAKNGGKVADVESVELLVPSERLKEGVIIVDSPGLNDPEIERSKITTDYMDRCDCILFFMNATQVWKRSEKEFIEERIFSKQHFNKIFFLINFWDLINKQERPEVEKYVKEQMNKSTVILKSNLQGQDEKVNEPSLIPVSAKTGENMDNLENILWSYLSDKRGQVLLQLKIRKIFNFMDIAMERIDESVDVYKKAQHQIEKDIDQYETEVAGFAQGVEKFRTELYSRVTPPWQNYVKGMKDLFADLEQKIGKELGSGLGSMHIFTDKVEIGKNMNNRAGRIIYQHKKKFQDMEYEFVNMCTLQVRAMKAELNLRQTGLVELKSCTNAIELQNLEIDDQMNTLYAGMGGMLLVAAVLGTLTGGVGALLSLVVLPFAQKYRKGQIEDFLKEHFSEIEDSIKTALDVKLEEISQSRDKIFEKILEDTRHEILELYREKQNLLSEAIKNKKDKIDQEIMDRTETTKNELYAVRNRLNALVEEAFSSAN